MDLKLQVLLQMLDKASAPLRGLKGASTSASDALRKTRDTLRDLDRQQGRLAGFRQLKRQLQDNKVQMVAMAQQARQLQAAVAAGGDGAKKAAVDLKRVTRASTQLRDARRQQLEQLRQLSGELAQSGIRTRTLGSAEERLRSDISRTTASLDKQTAALAAQAAQTRKLQAISAQLHKSQALAANLSIGGYAAMTGGRRLLEGIHPMIDEGKQYQLSLAQIRAQGGSRADISAAERFANTDDTRGSSINEKLDIVKDANSIFRDMREAVQVAPSLLKAKYTFENLMATRGEGEGHGQETVNQLIDAIRTGELRNATKTPADFQHLLDMMSRAYVGSGGLVKPSDYLEAMKVGGVAAKQMDEKSLFFGAMHTIQEMGGMRAGTGLASAYQNWAAGRSTQQTAEALAQLGLVNKDAVKYGKNGHITKMLPGALVNQGLYESNPFEYMMKEVIPLINPTGKLSDNEVVSKLNGLFSARKGGDLFAGMFMQRANIEKQLRASAKFSSLDESYNATSATAQGQEADLEAKKRDLYLELGRQILPLYVSGLQKLVAVMKSLTGIARNHPALAKAATVIAATLGVLMVAAGGLMIALGGLIGQFALLRFAARRAGLMFFGRAATGALGTGAAAGEGATGLRAFSIARAGLAAMTGLSAPVMALIAALAAGALLVWHYWQPIKAFFVGMGQGIATTVGPAFAAVGAALAPLKPAWDGIVAAARALWGWFTSLLTPMQATGAELAAATDAGESFGHVVGAGINGIIRAVTAGVIAFNWLGTAIGESIGWIVVKGTAVIDWLHTAWGTVSEAIKAPFVSAFAWVSDKIDALLAKWKELRSHFPGGGSADPASDTDSAVQPPRVAANTPLRAGGGAGATVITNHYPITVQVAPGQEKAAARAVSDELDRRDRAKAAANRSALADAE